MSTPGPVHAGPLVTRFLPAGEPVIRSMRPSLWWVVLAHPFRVLWWPGLWVLWQVVERTSGRVIAEGLWPHAVIVLGLALTVLYTVLRWCGWACVLTPRRVLSVEGLVGQTVRDLPLDRVQSAVVHRSVFERLLGLGTIVLSSASDSTGVVVWPWIDAPDRALSAVREAVDHDRSRA